MEDRDLFLQIANIAGVERKQAEQQNQTTAQTQRTHKSNALFAIAETLFNGAILYGLLAFCVYNFLRTEEFKPWIRTLKQ